MEGKKIILRVYVFRYTLEIISFTKSFCLPPPSLAPLLANNEIEPQPQIILHSIGVCIYLWMCSYVALFLYSLFPPKWFCNIKPIGYVISFCAIVCTFSTYSAVCSIWRKASVSFFNRHCHILWDGFWLLFFVV